MNTIIETLARLKQLRNRAVSELTGQLSQQKQLCARYERNIDALTALTQDSLLEGNQMAAMMDNQAHYKGHIQRVINWQKQEQVLADKQAQQLQTELVQEACREKTVELVLDARRDEVYLEQERSQQKITDALSAQCWLRQKRED